MSTTSGSSSRHKLWTYCLLCCWLHCWLCSGGLQGCIFSACWAEHFGVSHDTVWGSYLLWMVLNSGVEWLNVLNVLNIHMGLILVPLNSGCHADHFDTWLIFLWPTVLLWMVGLNGQMFWPFCMFWMFIWSWSWYQWTCLVMLIILIPGSFLYNQQFLHSTLHLIKHNLALGDPFGCRWSSICLAGNDLCPWREYT